MASYGCVGGFCWRERGNSRVCSNCCVSVQQLYCAQACKINKDDLTIKKYSSLKPFLYWATPFRTGFDKTSSFNRLIPYVTRWSLPYINMKPSVRYLNIIEFIHRIPWCNCRWHRRSALWRGGTWWSCGPGPANSSACPRTPATCTRHQYWLGALFRKYWK